MHDVPPKVDIEKREYTVPLVEPWKLPTTIQWELSWDNQIVVGPVATWICIRETTHRIIYPLSTYEGKPQDCSGRGGRNRRESVK
jgi:hypothetical protein